MQKGRTAKRIILLILVSFFSLSVINTYGQKDKKSVIEEASGAKVIKSPSKPTCANPFREIKLIEILRIKDDGVNFYFKEPWGIDVDDEGAIYIQDGIKLFRFNSAGKYLGNIIKKGQGPGEITGYLTHFSLNKHEVNIFCASMAKLLKLNPSGELIKEIMLKGKRVTGYLGKFKDKHFLFDFLPKNPEETQGIIEFNRNLYIVDEKGNFEQTEYTFPVKLLRNVRSIGGRSAVSSYGITDIRKSSVIQRYVYLSHAQEYQIIQFDLEKQKISRIFSREYPRVPCPLNIREFLKSIKYHNDIHRLLIHGNNVWVLTSSFDSGKGILVDVFNQTGEFIDSFYLPLFCSRTNESFSQLYFPIKIKDKYIYAIEHDEDWTFSIAKYEINDRN